jgi:hypothetical protein
MTSTGYGWGLNEGKQNISQYKKLSRKLLALHSNFNWNISVEGKYKKLAKSSMTGEARSGTHLMTG